MLRGSWKNATGVRFSSLTSDSEAPAVQAWRARMASEDGQQTYRRHKLTERAHGIIKNRGMSRAWS